MLHGRFGATTNSPYFEARISIPELNVSGHVSFLPDTGADTTTLMPADGVRLGLPWDDLSKGNPMPATGIGGQTEVFAAPASVTFRTEDEQRADDAAAAPGWTSSRRRPRPARVRRARPRWPGLSSKGGRAVISGAGSSSQIHHCMPGMQGCPTRAAFLRPRGRESCRGTGETTVRSCRSDERIDDRQTAYTSAGLKVFRQQRVALRFQGRSDDQRVVEVEPM